MLPQHLRRLKTCGYRPRKFWHAQFVDVKQTEVGFGYSWLLEPSESSMRPITKDAIFASDEEKFPSDVLPHFGGAKTARIIPGDSTVRIVLRTIRGLGVLVAARTIP